MTATGIPVRQLAVADHCQRMLLLCALTDACRRHERNFYSCAGCLAIFQQRENGACPAHQAAEEQFAAWTRLYVELDYESDRRPGRLDPDALTLLAAAVAAAITYRQDQPAAEDIALTSAYQELALLLVLQLDAQDRIPPPDGWDTTTTAAPARRRT